MKRAFRRTSGRQAANSHRVKLSKFELKFLVDEQQRSHCASHVAATGGDDLVDNGVGTIQVAVNHGTRHDHILRLKDLYATPCPVRISSYARYSQGGTGKIFITRPRFLDANRFPPPDRVPGITNLYCGPSFETAASRPPQDEALLVETQRPHARVTASPLSLEERATRASRSMGYKRLTYLSQWVLGPVLN